MITFFRINTYLHILSILVVLVLLKIPFISDGLPILNFELEWMLVGERLNSGNSLYADIWTNTAPLTSYVYGFLHFFFGKTQLYYELTALCLVYFQALFFTYLINRNKVIIERNYLPGLIYVLVMSLSFDLNKLTPALLATTFLLLAINSLFRHIDYSENSSEAIFEIGIFIGIGSLFLFPFSIFIFWAILSLVMFTNTKFNQILLVLLGFALPPFIASLYYYFMDSMGEFYNQWLSQSFELELISLNDLLDLGLIYSLPIMISVAGVFKVLQNSRYSNFQNRKHQTIILSALFAILIFFLSGDSAMYQMVCLSPFLAFYISGWFINLKGTIIPEVFFLVFVSVMVFIDYLALYDLKYLDELSVKKDLNMSYIEDRSLLVTGDRNDAYFYGRSGSTYLNWDVSKYDLSNPDIFESIISIQSNFEKELPEYIIDNEGVFPKIFEKIPELNNKYVRVEGTRNFRLKSIDNN